jgi:hypothetical protein
MSSVSSCSGQAGSSSCSGQAGSSSAAMRVGGGGSAGRRRWRGLQFTMAAAGRAPRCLSCTASFLSREHAQRCKSTPG